MFPSFLFPLKLPTAARPLAPRPHLIPSVYLTCILGSLLPPSSLRSLSIPFVVLYILSTIPRYSFGSVPEDYLFPIQGLLELIHWVDIWALNNGDRYVRVDGRDKKVEEKDEKGEGGKQITWWEKVGRAWELNISMRGVGWNWEVKNIPKAAPIETTKWQFARSQLTTAVTFYLINDIFSTILRSSTYSAPVSPNLFTDTIPRMVFFAWLPAISSYYMMNIQYQIASALTVLCGMYPPQDWPPIMGRLREVSSVRDMWGKFWHQLLRRRLNIPFTLLTRIFPIQKGTLLSRYLQLYLAFMVSASIHHIGALNVPSGSSANNRLQLAFFLMQPVAITFEDFVIYLGNKAGIKSSSKIDVLGKIWTASWFSFSLVPMAAFHYNAGFMSKQMVPSLIEGIVGMMGWNSGGKSEL